MRPTSELLEHLPSFPRTDLLDLWHKSFGRPASPGLRRELMLPILAFRIQELAHGGLRPETKARLQELTSSLSSKGQNDARRRFKSGTRLVREWKGKVHEVTRYTLVGSGLLRHKEREEGPMKANSRCAIYTRKSSEEGLEQSFNSLDAQREACEAYGLSQKHEGWQVLSANYDDGGFSGGNMERPGLKKLLDDIAAGKVDTVVVYKVDRLTRSLADFAKIVETFDSKGVSFVSVTQQFNTTTSMGRLTLNVLLSFAQFEREVTGERIRNKVAASKKKGMWMGGIVPLGYDHKDR